MKYNIQGDFTPVVICELEAGESMITESGSMVWMSPNMEMQTSGGGSLGKAFGHHFIELKLGQGVQCMDGRRVKSTWRFVFHKSHRPFWLYTTKHTRSAVTTQEPSRSKIQEIYMSTLAWNGKGFLDILNDVR